MYGWTGTILRVDLTTGEITREESSEKMRHDYIGGRGMNSRILYNEVKPGTDPLGPGNRLIWGNSPLTGTGLVTSGRIHVTAKSPLTGILGDSNAGGHFGPELKWAGYDGIVFEGRAEKPVYLWIDNDRAELRDAPHIWGKIVSETFAAIRDELKDPRIKIACIGPAGENMVYFGSIMTDYGNACGKTGMGAVMGSKNLKAIAVRGTKGFQVADKERFKAVSRDLTERIKRGIIYKPFSRVGTLMYLKQYDSAGRSLANNAQIAGNIDYIDNYSVESMMEHITRSVACFGCPIHCKHEFKIQGGKYAEEHGHGTEFCIMSTHGPGCGNRDQASLLKINNICNEYGICGDTSGVVLAAAFEWYQRGIITKEDADGLELEWGNSDAQIELLLNTIHRKGFGDALADGTAFAAQKLGGEAEKYISHAKGGDLDFMDVRSVTGCVLSDAVSSRGADPQRGWPGAVELFPLRPDLAKKVYGSEKFSVDPESYEGKGFIVNYFSNICTMCDTLGICKFTSKWGSSVAGYDEMAELISAATGYELDGDGIRRIAERITMVERAYLVREGVTRKDDTIHGRMMDEPVPTGIHKGKRIDWEKFSMMLDDYYDIVGWDKETGFPLRKTLEDLGLCDIADELAEMGKPV